jgi:hypothetical protein
VGFVAKLPGGNDRIPGQLGPAVVQVLGNWISEEIERGPDGHALDLAAIGALEFDDGEFRTELPAGEERVSPGRTAVVF